MPILELNEDNFDQIIHGNDLVVLDFWAEWCAPCKSFSKVIQKIEKEYPDVVFGSIDIDAEVGLAEEFQVQSVPLVMILRDAVVVYGEAGALAPGNLRDLIDQAKAIDPGELRREE